MRKVYLFFTVVLLLSMASAWAQGGTTGPLSWEINDGTLTISGEGEMPDYEKFGAPWFVYYTFGLPIHTVDIGFGVTGIGNYAFFLVETLTEIKIPNSITRIGDNAFGGCKNMTSIVLPNNLKNIESSAFSDCIGLTSIDLPNSISSLGLGVFWNCSSLTSITIPNSVTRIRQDSFAYCENLVSVSISNNVTNIEIGAFRQCSNLSSIVFPNSVDSIGVGAFHNCTSLTSIVIPNSVKSIDLGAFAGCTSLTSVTNYNTIPIDIGPSVFEKVNQSNCTLKVPANAISAYQNAEVWKEFNIVDLEESINTVESSNIKIYPNPTTGVLNLIQETINNEQLTINNIEIFDVYGRKQHAEGRKPNIIDISQLSAGIYFLKISTEAGEVVKKIIKK